MARGKLHLRENNCLGQIPFGGPRQNAEIGEKAGMFYSTMHSVNTNKWNLMWPTRCSSFVDATQEENSDILKMMMKT